jgi:hypothetical protein
VLFVADPDLYLERTRRMTVAAPEAIDLPPDRAEPVAMYFDADRIVTPDGNPVYTAAMLADLLSSMPEHGQLVPGWVCPSPDLPEHQRLCLEGNRRLAVCRLLGLPFWAFDLGRFVPEEERIKLVFHHHQSRRVMSRDEIAERASRYIEITGCTAAEAAKHLNISGTALSRAFGEQRIPPELKARAEQLGPTIRTLLAATPEESMAQVLEYAETVGVNGRKPTRDQVSLFIRSLKKSGKPKSRRPRALTLRMGGREVTISVTDKDSAGAVAEDLKAMAAKLGKLTDVPPDAWPFLFQS